MSCFDESRKEFVNIGHKLSNESRCRRAQTQVDARPVSAPEYFDFALRKKRALRHEPRSRCLQLFGQKKQR